MHIFFRLFFFLTLGLATMACNRQSGTDEKLADASKPPLSDDAAIQAATAALEKEPSAQNYRKRAALYIDKKEYNQALADIDQALALDSTKGDFFYIKSKALRGQKQVPAALKAAIRAEQKGLSNADLFLNMGEMYLILKQYQQAISYLNKSLGLAQFNEQAYFYKGLVYAESGDTTRAISSFQTAIEQAPNYVEPYNALIKIYNVRKDNAMAEQYLKSGLRFVPADPYLWYNQGVLMRNSGKADTAVASFERALVLDSTLFLAAYNLGTMAYQREDYHKAVQYLRQTLRYTNQLPGTDLLLAYSLEQTGDLEGAEKYYRAASVSSPNDPEVRQGLIRIEQARAKASAEAANRKS